MAHSSLIFQAFRSLLIVSFHRNFGRPLGRFPSIFISATARMFSVSPLLFTCPNHSSLLRLITVAIAKGQVPGQINTTKNHGMVGDLLLWQIPGSLQKATLPSATTDRCVIDFGCQLRQMVLTPGHSTNKNTTNLRLHDTNGKTYVQHHIQGQKVQNMGRGRTTVIHTITTVRTIKSSWAQHINHLKDDRRKPRITTSRPYDKKLRKKGTSHAVDRQHGQCFQ